MDLVDGDSFYLQTGSMDINGLPHKKEAWHINGAHKYQVFLDAHYGEQRPDCAMFFIQYDAEKRIAHKYQQIYNGLNKIEFETTPDARYFKYRLAFQRPRNSQHQTTQDHCGRDAARSTAITLGKFANLPEEIAPLFELKAQSVDICLLKKRIHALGRLLQWFKKTHFGSIKKISLGTCLFEKPPSKKIFVYSFGKNLAKANPTKLGLAYWALPKNLIKNWGGPAQREKFEISPWASPPSKNFGTKADF
uniref:Uncharacterized protein n=1 Tax=Aeromonas hydrophila TaxID=644 RepID=Q84AP4_AERHY|nr:unknown [Aeromonas hydrophila]